jgi:uncharacterized membrane protein YkoI
MRLPSRLLVAIPLAAALTFSGGCQSANDATDDSTSIAIAEVPAPVRAVFEREAAGSALTNVTTSIEDGKRLYTAEYTRAGRNVELEVFADGQICCVETTMNPADLPAAVKATLAREAPGLAITKAELKQSKGVTSYEVDVEGPGAEGELEIAADGKLIEKDIERDVKTNPKKSGAK